MVLLICIVFKRLNVEDRPDTSFQNNFAVLIAADVLPMPVGPQITTIFGFFMGLTEYLSALYFL